MIWKRKNMYNIKIRTNLAEKWQKKPALLPRLHWVKMKKI